MFAAPYMWSGGLASHPLVTSYQYASSMLPWKAPAQHHAPLPTVEEIQQTFHTARQQSPFFVEPNFSHARVIALHKDMRQEQAQTATPELSGSIAAEQRQQHDTSYDNMHGANTETAPAQGSSEEAPAQSSVETNLHDGSGVSWQQDEVSGLEAYLRRSWGRAMSAARAGYKPITFFGQDNGGQPQTDAESTETVSHGAYTPFPVITAELFSRAWREAQQQAAGMAGKWTASAGSSADSGPAHAPAKELHSLQDAVTAPSASVWRILSIFPERLQRLKSTVKSSTSNYASNVASSLREKADSVSQSMVSSTQPRFDAKVMPRAAMHSIACRPACKHVPASLRYLEAEGIAHKQGTAHLHPL